MKSKTLGITFLSVVAFAVGCNQEPTTSQQIDKAKTESAAAARDIPVVLLTVGGQMVAATENALINTLEAPLAIAWVWLTFGEAPSVTSLSGGIVVMTAVAVHVWHGSRLRLRPAVTYTSG